MQSVYLLFYTLRISHNYYQDNLLSLAITNCLIHSNLQNESGKLIVINIYIKLDIKIIDNRYLAKVSVI